MAEINAEYDYMLQHGFADTVRQDGSPDLGFTSKAMREYQNIVYELIKIKNITIEICGAWIWISGDTKPCKNRLKALGCFWASKKKMWYWRPAAMKGKSSHRPVSMQKIRAKYGSSVVIKDDKRQKVQAIA